MNTVDYFNVCYDTTNTIASFWVPSNVFGFQEPNTGNAYAGFYNISKGGIFSDAREYLGAQLLQPLQFGTKYFVSFKVSLADYSGCTASNIGMKFLQYKTFGDTTILPPPLVNNFAHIYVNSAISDSIGWVNVCGSFVADSAYNYFVIGNFFDYSHINPIGASCASYYYVDDVYISSDSIACLALPTHTNSPTEERPRFYPNPAVNYLTIEAIIESPIEEVIVINTLDQVIAEIKTNHSFRETIDVSNYPNGVYLLKVRCHNKTFYKKQLIVH